ncbi:MAG: hypothetical protein HYR51_02365 [Candidatus Rokubacteria bacterium]|nr:hypothetical protein [Candidatus Rokubacteria bacterium]
MLTRKLGNVGFESVAIRDRRPFGLAALARYDIFPPEFLDFVRRVVPPEHHDSIVYAVDVTARNAA